MPMKIFVTQIAKRFHYLHEKLLSYRPCIKICTLLIWKKSHEEQSESYKDVRLELIIETISLFLVLADSVMELPPTPKIDFQKHDFFNIFIFPMRICTILSVELICRALKYASVHTY